MKTTQDLILGRLRQKDEIDIVEAKEQLGLNNPSLAYKASDVDLLLSVSERSSAFLKILQYLGSTVKALPIDAGINGITAGTSALTSRAIYRVPFFIEKSVTITGINFVMQTPFSGTGDQYNGFGLYSVDIATGLSTKITETVNDPNLFKAAAFTLGAKAFPVPVGLTPGLYYVDLIYCSSVQTTQPIMYTWGPVSANNVLYVPATVKLIGLITNQTDLPATVNNSAYSATSALFSINMY